MLSRIQFYTKEERMTHPLARLFSEAMWQTVFHGELDAIYQVLMLESHEERLQEIIVSCQAQSFNTANNISWQRAFLAIAVSHPYFTPDQLINVSRLLTPLPLSDENIFQC